jgi:UDP-3-O-[3-hydroxymyristoyl] N-acetylglucosamine deacetylase/ATP-dependent RNA helicase DDX20
MIGTMSPALRASPAAPKCASRVSAAARAVSRRAGGGAPRAHRAFGAVGSRSALPARRARRAAVTRAAAPSNPKIERANDDAARPFFDSKEANDIRGYANFTSRQELADAALVDRHAIPKTPLSVPYQQTLRRSFALVGIGLHSGEVETVRVCPANANEGRYFVRVPPGTIPPDAARDETGGAFSRADLTDEETEDLVLEQLRSMMRGADENKDGSLERAELLRKKSESAAESPEAFGVAGEERVAASVVNTQTSLRLSTRLGDKEDANKSVGTVEHLLAALEALGVDNARIEVEGTGELPILDGSAYPFCYHAARVGLTKATADGAPEGAETERRAWRLDEPVTVREGDAFISLYPDAVTKLTYGIDFTYKSRAIGKQWESWTPSEDGRFADVLARARTFATMPDIMAYFRAGYIKGGTEHCALIANGDTFWNPPMLLPNEPARHKLLDLLGDLSLLAEPGHVGVPVGHVVAYKAGHELHAKFALKVKEAIEAGKATRVPAEMWAREEGPAANDAEVASMRKTEPME